jgi:hypothetical protein
MDESASPSYIFRIPSRDVERQLYGQRILYVSLKREWSRNTRLLFVRKTAFIGYGIIDRFVLFGNIKEDKNKIFLENNFYGKIEFGKLVRFFPAIPVDKTSLVGQNNLGLHGSSLSLCVALQIEVVARSRIII